LRPTEHRGDDRRNRRSRGTGRERGTGSAVLLFSLADEEVATFFRAVARASSIPLLYYHYPEMTACRISVPTLMRLTDEGAIVGLKDSGGDAALLARLATALGGRDDFRLFLGAVPICWRRSLLKSMA
jgi:dihydrodipicolinate synthase/N-acetylneuraminate lyase